MDSFIAEHVDAVPVAGTVCYKEGVDSVILVQAKTAICESGYSSIDDTSGKRLSS